MTKVFTAAAEVQRFLQDRQWEFCFIGGVALQRWGNPRVTVDADLTLLTGFSDEERFVDVLLEGFEPRRSDAREVALRQRVVLLYAANGTGLDIALGGLPFEEHSTRRATLWNGPENAPALLTCSAEDLIVHKAFAARDQDWADVTTVVMRQGPKLKVEQIWEELRPLVELKEEPAIIEKLERIFSQHLE